MPQRYEYASHRRPLSKTTVCNPPESWWTWCPRARRLIRFAVTSYTAEHVKTAGAEDVPGPGRRRLMRAPNRTYWYGIHPTRQGALRAAAEGLARRRAEAEELVADLQRQEGAAVAGIAAENAAGSG